MIPPRAQTTRLYRLVALASAGISIALLVAITYVAFASAELTITLASKPVTTSFSVSVSQQDQAERHVTGLFLRTTVQGERLIAGTPGTATPAKARGSVRLQNETNRVQPLQASTRLLSEQGVLFRTLQRVDVPAQDTVDVEVEADQPGVQGEIGPSRFTLPALQPSTQKQIFGSSTTAMTGGSVSTTVVTDQDRAKGESDLEVELLGQALRDIEKAGREQNLSFQAAVLSNERLPVAAADGHVALRLGVNAIIYDRAALLTRIREELQQTLGNSERLLAVEENTVRLTLKSSDADAKTAVVGVTARGQSALADAHPSLAKERFAGKSHTDVNSYARSTSGVAQATLRLSPFWARRVPSQPGRIRLHIVTPDLTAPSSDSTVEAPK